MIILILAIIIITIATMPSLIWVYLAIPILMFTVIDLQERWALRKMRKEEERRKAKKNKNKNKNKKKLKK